MSTNKFKKIEKFFTSGIFYGKYNNYNQFVNYIKNSKKKIRIIYGETYDSYGLTLDSVKYYFLLEIFRRLICELGKEVEVFLMVGDIASIRNIDSSNANTINYQIKENLKLIKKIFKKFKLKINILLMSEYFKSDEFKNNTFKTQQYYSNKKIQNLLYKTVIKNKLTEEIKKGFQYSLEEIALIGNFDIKIGPPRERNYDKASKLIFQKPIGLYVKPTYPLGLNYDFFINNPEIDEFGLTPYKAGSNKLFKNRIIFEKSSIFKIEELINKTFIPNFSDLANPLLDTFLICDLAERINNNNLKFEKYKNFKDLKNSTINLLKNNFNEFFR